jgi:hypothetical protein
MSSFFGSDGDNEVTSLKLLEAAKSGAVAMVQELIKKGGNVNYINSVS